MAQKKSGLSGIGVMAGLTFVSKLVRLLVLMVTARFLSPEDFGVVAAFSMILALAYLFTDMGLMKTLIQRPIINKFHIGSAITVSVIFGIAVSVALIFGSGIIEELSGVPGVKLPLQLSSCLFILLAISNICSALFQRNGEIIFIGKIQSFSTIFGSLCVTVPLLWFDFGYWSIIIGIFVAEFTALTIITWRGRAFLTLSIAKKEVHEIIKYSSAFFSHNLIILISKQIDSAIIGRYLGSSALGNYSRSVQLIEFPNQIYWLVVDRVVFPSMSAMKTDKEKLRCFFVDVYSLLLIPLTIGAVILFLGAKEIIGIMMGEGWEVVIILIQILAVNVVFKCITGFVDSFLAAYGVIKALTYKNLFSLIVFTLAILVGVRFGLNGVAYAVVFASSINLFLSIGIAIFYAQVPSKNILLATIPAFSMLLMLILMYISVSMIITAPALVNILIATISLGALCFIFPSETLLSNNGKKFILKIKKTNSKSKNKNNRKRFIRRIF